MLSAQSDRFIEDKDECLERERSFLKSQLLPWLRILLVSAAFGGAALAIVEAGLTIPIPGSGVVTDPREIFTTIGAGFTGPVGGIVIGILAGFREPGGIEIASLLAHVSGGLWMGLSYKLLAYNHLKMPFLLIGWVMLVLVFYYVFAVPGFVIGQMIFYPEGFLDSYGAESSVVDAYAILSRGVLPEALLTTFVTTLVFVALPRRHRRPLW